LSAPFSHLDPGPRVKLVLVRPAASNQATLRGWPPFPLENPFEFRRASAVFSDALRTARTRGSSQIKRWGELAPLLFSAQSLEAVCHLGFEMMRRSALAGAGLSRRFLTRQTLFVALAICAVWFLGTQLRRGSGTRQWSPLRANPLPPPRRMPTHNVLPPLPDPVACYGPRGLLLDQSRDDQLESRKLQGRKRTFPPPPVPHSNDIRASLTRPSRQQPPINLGQAPSRPSASTVPS
jgi:hypothetical protein